VRVGESESSLMASSLKDICSVMPGESLITLLLRSCDVTIISYMPVLVSFLQV
jgi:hypothetical protein